jgi:hypothetical protein
VVVHGGDLLTGSRQWNTCWIIRPQYTYPAVAMLSSRPVALPQTSKTLLPAPDRRDGLANDLHVRNLLLCLFGISAMKTQRRIWLHDQFNLGLGHQSTDVCCGR